VDAVGTVALLKVGSGTANPGDTKAGSTLSWAQSSGNGGSNVGTGTWRVEGAIIVAQGATAFVRIS
jgi:hypothetical protein